MKQDDLIVCAFRYCLGRSTYVVSEMCDHLLEHWAEICPQYQELIKKEIKDAIERGNCGMDIDCICWSSLVESIEAAEDVLKDVD